MKLFEPPRGLHTGRWTVCLAPGLLVAYSSCPPCSFLKVLRESGAAVKKEVQKHENMWKAKKSGEKERGKSTAINIIIEWAGGWGGKHLFGHRFLRADSSVLRFLPVWLQTSLRSWLSAAERLEDSEWLNISLPPPFRYEWRYTRVHTHFRGLLSYLDFVFVFQEWGKKRGGEGEGSGITKAASGCGAAGLREWCVSNL